MTSCCCVVVVVVVLIVFFLFGWLVGCLFVGTMRRIEYD